VGEFKKLKWFPDRSDEKDGLQEKDSEFTEFLWRRKQDVTVGWQLLCRHLGWLMYKRASNLSKAKETVCQAFQNQP